MPEPRLILLSGADVILPTGLSSCTVVVQGDRIVDVVKGRRTGGPGDSHLELGGHYLAPGFIDVHVHGADGIETLGDGEPIAELSRRLPRYGVTAFCPTSIACDPATLARLLACVRRARLAPQPGARVLPAHLESNFINPDFKGGQPAECLRVPHATSAEGEFTGDEILAVIAAARPDVGIVTIAPELEGALALIAGLVAHGHRISLGHSAATFEQAIAGIEAGATHATHLFNRMPPLGHRAPGLAGAVLQHDGVAAEVICDMVHVHPAMVRLALATKRVERFMAVTDGTPGSGLPWGSVTRMGGRTITVREAAYLPDGTLSGSTITMDRAFANLVETVGVSLHEASAACSTTPARELGLHGLGVIAPGSLADLVVLDRDLAVEATFVNGEQVFLRGPGGNRPEPPSFGDRLHAV
jgi:N-acetylglucosamine-6-phosphate deacetylase